MTLAPDGVSKSTCGLIRETALRTLASRTYTSNVTTMEESTLPESTPVLTQRLAVTMYSRYDSSATLEAQMVGPS